MDLVTVFKLFLYFTVLFVQLVESLSSPFSRRSSCPIPTIPHGKARSRQRHTLVKYVCSRGYRLEGSKFAVCRGGVWDKPLPICVAPGCTIPTIDNALVAPSPDKAVVEIFCMPGYFIEGSPTLWCDGNRWNDTAPICASDKSTIAPKLSCDFENPDLCGWRQDVDHDFDWRRMNRKSPTAFLYTGPSYDHTFGINGNGYYMYIESASRSANDVARLISPLYPAELAKHGCFSFYYHMYGKSTGGLRVYQKPVSENLRFFLDKDYAVNFIIFELWNDQGNKWYRSIQSLQDYNEDFQIIIEGIRGSGVTSNTAIDDVAVLQGLDCLAAIIDTNRNTFPDSCEHRCGAPNQQLEFCSCVPECTTMSNCCADYFDVCLIQMGGDDKESSPTDLPPQTEKLVRETLSTTTSMTTTTMRTTPRQTTTTSIKTTTAKPSTTTTVKPTLKTTTLKPVIRNISTTSATKISTKVNNITKKKIMNTTTVAPPRVKIPTTTLIPTTEKRTTVKIITSTLPTTKFVGVSRTFENHNDPIWTHSSEAQVKSKNSTGKTTLIVFAVLLCLAAILVLAIGAQTAGGRAYVERLRGRIRHDNEVRYLNSDRNDEELD